MWQPPCPFCKTSDHVRIDHTLDNVVRTVANVILAVPVFLFFLLLGGIEQHTIFKLSRSCTACGLTFRTQNNYWRRCTNCLQCGYQLTGNQSGVCPECGWKLPPAFISYERKRRESEIIPNPDREGGAQTEPRPSGSGRQA